MSESASTWWAMMRDLLCSLFRPRAVHLLAALSCVVACSGSERPPPAKVAPVFHGFSIAGGSGAAWNHARRSAEGERAEPLGTGPHAASLVSDGFTSHQDYVARFDGALCPAEIGVLREGSEAVVVHEWRDQAWVPVEGNTHWRSDRSVSFQAAVPWSTATRYRVRLPEHPCPDGTLVAKGGRVGSSYEHVFDPVDVHWSNDRELPLLANAAAVLWVNHPVTLSDVREATVATATFEAKADYLVPLAVEGKRDHYGDLVAGVFTLRPADGSPWPAGARMKFSVDGLRSSAGPEPVARAGSMHTQIIRSPQAFVPRCPRACDPSGDLVLSTTRDVPDDALERVEVSPRLRDLEIEDRAPHKGGHGELRIGGRISPNTDYQITFPAGFPDSEGGSLANEVVVNVATGDVEPFLAFDTEREQRWEEGDEWGTGEEHTGPEWNHDDYDESRSFGDVHVMQASRPMTVGVMGRRVRAFEVRVSAIDDAAIADWTAPRPKGAPALVATEVARATISVRPKGNTAFVSHALDLKPLVGARRGLFMVEIEPAKYLRDAPASPDAPSRQVVLLSDLGPAVATSTTRTTLHLRKLSTNATVADASVKLLTPTAAQPLTFVGMTDANGELELRTRLRPPAGPTFLVIDAPDGDRTVLELPGEYYGDDDDDSAQDFTELGEHVSGRLVVERGIYRPGESVHVLGWSVVHTPWSPHRIRELPQGTQMRVWMEHRRLGTLAYQNVATGAHGKFTADFDLPDEITSGSLVIHAQAVDDADEGWIESARARVRDFRIPTFWVSAHRQYPEDGDKRERSGQARFLATAQAYSGGAVPVIDALVTHDCHTRRPRAHDYGLPQGWIVGERGGADVSAMVESTVASPPSDLAPATDGGIAFSMDWRALPPGKVVQCHVDASLMDGTLQAYAGGAGITEATPGTVVAVQTEQRWRTGREHVLRLRAVSSSEARVQMDGVGVRVLRRELVEQHGQPSGELAWAEVVRCDLELASEGDDAACVVPPVTAGIYEIEVVGPGAASTRVEIHAGASTRESSDEDEKNEEDSPEYRTLCERTATGETCDSQWLDPGFDSRSAATELSVNPKVDHIRVGDPLHVAVRGPWHNADGVLLVGEGGHLGRVPFHMRKGRAELRLDVNEEWVGGVDLIAWIPRSGKSKLPSFDAARAHVTVSTASRTLKVELSAPSRAEAGDTLPIEIDVHDRDGQAAPGRVSLWMVDKAVLDLTHYQLPSVARRLLPDEEVYSSTVTYYDEVRAPFEVRRHDPGGWGVIGLGNLGLIGKGSGGGGSAGGLTSTPVSGREVRERFAITPLFLADVALDAQGHADASVTLPGNLTTFTIMAVATDALRGEGAREDAAPGRFGRAQHQVQVDMPFSVRIAAPRHLRPGDRVQLGATLVNRSERSEDVSVEVSVEAGPLALLGPQTRTVTVPAGSRQRVDFDAVAGSRDGDVALRMAVRNEAGTVDDAEQRVVQVRHERLRDQSDAFTGTLEAVASSKRAVRAGALRVPIELPADVDPQQVDVSVELASSALVQLGRNITMLSRYPYGCTEQTSSAMLMSLAVSGPRLSLLFPDESPQAHIEAAIHRLSGRERGDGAFRYWPGDGRSFNAWASVQATWVLLLAHDAGFVVPEGILERALGRLRDELGRGKASPDPNDPDAGRWDPNTRAFAAFVLADTNRIEAPEPELGERELDEDDARRLAENWARGITDGLDAIVETSGSGTIEHEAMRAYTLARLGGPEFDASAALQALERALSFREGADPAISPTGSLAFVHPSSLQLGLADNFGSTARATALVLIAVLQLDPDAQVVDALAAGLLSQRERGHWGTTQANAFVLIALQRWAASREAAGTAIAAEVWLSRRRMLDVELSDATQARAQASGPLRVENERGRSGLIVSARGRGRVYYQAVLTRQRGSDRDELPADRGLHLRRVLRDSDGEVGSPPVAGAGDLLALDIVLEADTDTRYVAVDVPMPAGVELIATDLASQAGRMPLPGTQGEWVSHVSPEKDRVIVFADDLEAGTHVTTVFVRATAAGHYDWPRARAQAMYMPEITGWSAGGSVQILPRD